MLFRSPGLAKIADKLDELKTVTEASVSSEPAVVDQSTHVHGNLYGGDAGLRHLNRELTRAGRLDSNRVIR